MKNMNMDFFKSISPGLAERTRSPLYGSFVISWLIVNWKIILAVLLFNKQDLQNQNIVDFIKFNYINVFDALIIPLSFSLLYLLVMPWIDYFIIWYSEIAKRKKLDKKIEIGRQHKVEGNLFYDLKLRFEEEREKFLKVEEELIVYKNKVTEKESLIKDLNQTIDRTRNDFTVINNRHSYLENRHDIERILKGRWTVEYDKSSTNSPAYSEQINVVGYEYRIVKNGNENTYCVIELVDFDMENNKLSFVKPVSNGNNKIITIVELKVISNDRFEGYENGNHAVTYIKSKFRINDPEINIRDHTSYVFKGKTYAKNRLVLAVLTQYVENSANLSYTELEEKFPQSLQGSELFTTSEKAKAKTDKRNFTKTHELITLSDSVIAVSNQWSLENTTRFIEHCRKMDIEIDPKA